MLIPLKTIHLYNYTLIHQPQFISANTQTYNQQGGGFGSSSQSGASANANSVSFNQGGYGGEFLSFLVYNEDFQLNFI